MNFETIFSNLFVFGIIAFLLWFVYSFSHHNARSEAIYEFKKLNLWDKVKAYFQALYITFLGVILLTGGGIWYVDSEQNIQTAHYANYNLLIECWVVVVVTAIIGATRGFKEANKNSSTKQNQTT